MPINPLVLAIRQATRIADEYARLFAKVGNKDHPRGFVMTAYRNAKRALRGSDLSPVSIREILNGLRQTLLNASAVILQEARQAGMDNVAAQLDAYGLDMPLIADTSSIEQIAALSALVESQLALALAASVSGQGDLITGDDERQGIVRPGPFILALTGFIVAVGESSILLGVSPYKDSFKKQAIAAIDNRTTDCCLRVHGQIVPLDDKFHLTGTPRFADYQDWSPFHYNCRTSIALYQEGFDVGITDTLRNAAAQEIKLRRSGQTTPGKYHSGLGGDNG